MKIRPIFVLMLILSCFLMGCNTLQATGGNQVSEGNSSYQGQTISFVVPFQAGGGTDVFARFMTPYFAKHIEGKPRVQVENIPGGASITGTNEYANSRLPNGLNILTSSASSHVPFMLEQSSVDYDLNNFTPLIGAPSGGVVYTKPELAEGGIENLMSLEEELFYAGISPTGLDLVTLLSFEVLKMDVKAVLGYEGRGPSRVAFEQGESNIDYQTTTAYKNSVEALVEEGRAVPLYSLGQIDANGDLIRDPQFPDLPTIEEIYVDIYGEKPSGEVWDAYKQTVGASYTLNKVIWVHKDAPSSYQELLKKGMDGLINDKEFATHSEEILEGYDTYVGEELNTQIKQSFAISEETKQWIIEYLRTNFDIDIKKL
ncbi:hypothetical protein [Oceanobacillus polygoni]|uniref:Tripartite-type tricarboxylate transporter receptor subunit TctC n=1 Tax=Oceanobacillus polygoni TaxID=1235259 RepID=A0A9X0YQR7_9BACI|nr:hypothetical protein [Oceanobacillus polygoni]MBP2076969.1 hypothetical protein [Oceanobacillus polygoni]